MSNLMRSFGLPGLAASAWTFAGLACIVAVTQAAQAAPRTDASAGQPSVTIPLVTMTQPSGTDQTARYVATDLTDLQHGLYVNVAVVGIAGSVPTIVPRPANYPSTPAAAANRSASQALAGTSSGGIHALRLDTGSWATVVSQALVKQAVPGFDPSKYPSGSVSYSSDGVAEIGVWVPLELAFPDAPSPMGGIQTTIVDALVTTDNGPHYMLGVGFNARFTATVTGETLTPLNNAFLNLPQMKAGGLPHSYVIDREGVHLGLTKGKADAGWVLQHLQPSSQQLPAGSPKDWQYPVAIVHVGRVRLGQTSMMNDTGLDKMTVEFYGATPFSAAPGTKVDVFMSGSGLSASYGFTNGLDPATQPLAPSALHTIEPHPGREGIVNTHFINTGVNFFRGFDAYYNADAGLYGIRAIDP